MQITISANFADRAAFIACRPNNVTFSYEADGQPLTPEHQDKANRIWQYHVTHEVYPAFLRTDDLRGEAWIELDQWTNEDPARPKFNLTDIRTGQRIEGLPNAKGGRKSAV